MGIFGRDYDPYNRTDSIITGCLYGLILSLAPMIAALVMSAPFLWRIEGLLVPVVFTLCGGVIGFFLARKP